MECLRSKRPFGFGTADPDRSEKQEFNEILQLGGSLRSLSASGLLKQISIRPIHIVLFMLAVVSVKRARVTMATLGLRVFFCMLIALYEIIGDRDAMAWPNGNVLAPRF